MYHRQTLMFIRALTERVIESVHCNKLSVEFKLNLEKM